ncbi:hypothetical protein [Stenotrophomonas sp. CFBP8980]|uniref:hypothetical protein n=1 Tax=Stenotrophomonas sp. CFBP8980 TaxID=3096523 RepID=UPI002A6B5B9B|nr:hypothetical protein [Stenotrophomonas sp. CFBP8980]MDY1032063.1 hypothetical protein [Stenotrophomonas sp. CFBP8980]
MSLRPEVQVQLDALAEMLDYWVARVRHPAQFWPQFEMLAEEILEQCGDTEKEQVRALIQTMLRGHGLELMPGCKE